MNWMVTLCILLLSTAHLQAQESPVEVPQIGIRVDLRSTVEIEGVKITFLEVLEDSRCPKDVTCIWEGRVRAFVRIETPGEAPVEKEVIIGKTLQNESANKTLAVTSDFRLAGLNVLPYPETAAGEKGPYTLLVVKQKLQ